MERPVSPPLETCPRECNSCRFYLLTFPLKVRAFPETLVFVTVVHGKLQARRNILIGSHVRMYVYMYILCFVLISETKHLSDRNKIHFFGQS